MSFWLHQPGLTCWGDGLTPSRGQQALLCLCLCESSQGSRARLVLPISLQDEVGPRLDSAHCLCNPPQPLSKYPGLQGPSLRTSVFPLVTYGSHWLATHDHAGPEDVCTGPRMDEQA